METVAINSLRELDALVAEKVMGAEVLPSMVTEADWSFEVLPRYSANISAAWKLVEFFDNPHTSVVIETYSAGWSCRIVKSSPEIFQGLAKTAPIAICLAALKTVGIEVQLADAPL